MNRPSLAVLDVGHGNAAVLLDTGGVVVIDAGKGGVLIDFLKQAGIRIVDVLLISHADTDHIRNAPDLLLDEEIIVRRICYNSDPSKQSLVWKLFRKAIKTARREKGLLADPQLTTSQTGRFDLGRVRVEILYPFPETAASAPGGTTDRGETLTSNSMSAVVRLNTAAGPIVLLAGDVERGSLDAWREEGVEPTAHVLVFPHHGGNPGSNDPVAFAEEFTRLVKPQVVLFSIHRSHYELPIPEVVKAVRLNAPGARVACTQLSTHCASMLPDSPGTHLVDTFALGRDRNSCCAGTVIIDLSGPEPTIQPILHEHRAFIDKLPGLPLCTRPFNGIDTRREESVGLLSAPEELRH